MFSGRPACLSLRKLASNNPPLSACSSMTRPRSCFSSRIKTRERDHRTIVDPEAERIRGCITRHEHGYRGPMLPSRCGDRFDVVARAVHKMTSHRFNLSWKAGCELALPQTPQRSRSSARSDVTSGKRGVILQSNGVGSLIVGTSAALQLSVGPLPARRHSHE